MEELRQRHETKSRVCEESFIDALPRKMAVLAIVVGVSVCGKWRSKLH